MHNMTRVTLRDADVILLVVDASDIHNHVLYDPQLLTRLQNSTLPVIVVLNKMDAVTATLSPIPLSNSYLTTTSTSTGTSTTSAGASSDSTVAEFMRNDWKQRLPNAVAVVPISAKQDQGVDTLLQVVLRYTPEGKK